MDDFVWACTGVYGPNDNGQQSTLWEKLSQVRARWPMAWCLVGDFNIIENNSLFDLPLEGASLHLV